jgi:hypothetical protein
VLKTGEQRADRTAEVVYLVGNEPDELLIGLFFLGAQFLGQLLQHYERPGKALVQEMGCGDRYGQLIRHSLTT